MSTRLNWNEYATAWARLHGGFDPRLATPVVSGWLRMAYLLGAGLARLRVKPLAVTVFGLLLCLAVPLSVTRPPYGIFLGASLVVLSAVADSVDGAVAVTTGEPTRLGYVYDSLADRLGEAAWLTAFWLLGGAGPLVVAAGVLSWLHEYVRARAAAAGMREIGAVTVGERPTRVCVAAIGLLVAGAGAAIEPELPSGIVTLVTAVWILLAVFGLVQLMAAVRTALR
ncbi:CDP-diacylglycerol--glycerol-3-phosphate 3-phosphatidyltransferase [Micromonospora pattaloongensis]|uniref:CDP-diacylglycerol--glycerol-3-phosphate 3-phosphatidyltransferase n=1 Tax=Micromonospora pattaloongensis TaxID=405436 RepID=A0A1H3Q1A1_9ACTN|nr:CDP-diacylglycerol--glycerol-3-phosphate 3-phosphatidyltransferase [Micromonospora pattaloongensis]